jgi:magnesium chelatase family protein
MLVAAANPCPCGFAGTGDRCRCSETELARHRRRLSGPLLDRIDLLTHLQYESRSALSAAPLTSSTKAREQVLRAREVQAARLGEDGVTLNAHMDARLLRTHVTLGEKAHELMRAAGRTGMLSARGESRVLRVARTIADLNRSDRVRARDIGAALALRPDASLASVHAA